MAYMSQERKAQLAVTIKNVCKTYNIKASLSVHHHSTLVLNIKSGPIDFIKNFNEVEAKRNMCREPHMREHAKGSMSVNPYWYHEHFSGVAKQFLQKVIAAMNVGNHDNSDIMTDYFDVGWYVQVNIGKWDKPYVYA